jgi:hypothetical protein
MKRVRMSTLLLLVVFAGSIVLYLFVRPAPASHPTSTPTTQTR